MTSESLVPQNVTTRLAAAIPIGRPVSDPLARRTQTTVSVSPSIPLQRTDAPRIDALTPRSGGITRPPAGSREAALRGDPNPNEARNESRRALAKKFVQELGSGILEALQNQDVTDIERNTDGRTWVTDARNGKYEVTGNAAIDDWGALNLMGVIAALSMDTRQNEITRDSPHLETTIEEIFPDMPGAGCRFTATIPPQAKRPMFAIRKPSGFVYSLTDYIEQRLINQRQFEYLRESVIERHNFGIVGATGSGKTSFAKAILKEMSEVSDQYERFAILEDTPELVCSAPNKYEQCTVPHLGIDMGKLVRAALRYTPTRICVGEIRHEGAFETLDAFNTGHTGGLVTWHGGDPHEGLERFRHAAVHAGQMLSRLEVARSFGTIIVATKLPKRPRKLEIYRVELADERNFNFTQIS